MSKIDSLARKLESLKNKAVGSIPDQEIAELIHEETRASLFAKLEAWFDETLTEEEKHTRMLEISQQEEENDRQKSPVRRERERRYYLKYPVAGAADALMAKLNALSDDDNEDNQPDI